MSASISCQAAGKFGQGRRWSNVDASVEPVRRMAALNYSRALNNYNRFLLSRIHFLGSESSSLMKEICSAFLGSQHPYSSLPDHPHPAGPSPKAVAITGEPVISQYCQGER